jgi:geranylgeranyl pyrophosphate synthase
VAKINLSRMDVQALIDLRKQVEDTLVSQRSTLEKQLAALGGSITSLGGRMARAGRGSILKGKRLRPNIVVRMARRGRDAVPSPVGWLRQSRKARS